jgi:anti-sigma regulatory factor (Ser/Thr protein kinase)
MSGSTNAHSPDLPMGDPHAVEGGTGAWHEAVVRLPRSGATGVSVPPSHHGHDLECWPLHNTLLLGAVESAVPSARAHLRQLLGKWDRAEACPDAGVVVSELVTNAIAASAELRPTVAPVLVWLGSDGHCVLVAVADASPRPPMRLNVEPDAESGRGLTLVEAFSSRWGWHPSSSTGLAKVVWAESRLPSEASRRPTVGPPDRCHAA